jgi:hypothetical protein
MASSSDALLACHRCGWDGVGHRDRVDRMSARDRIPLSPWLSLGAAACSLTVGLAAHGRAVAHGAAHTRGAELTRGSSRSTGGAELCRG